MNIELRKASPQDKAIFFNLWEFYIYDFSEMNPIFEVDSSGRFGGAPENYWEEPDRHPFLIYANGKLAGFVLINQTEPIQRIGQFFVMRKYRQKGVGEKAATQSFEAFPGKWNVGVISTNTGAIKFWRKIISRYTQCKFEERTDDKGIDFIFENKLPYDEQDQLSKIEG